MILLIFLLSSRGAGRLLVKAAWSRWAHKTGHLSFLSVSPPAAPSVFFRQANQSVRFYLLGTIRKETTKAWLLIGRRGAKKKPKKNPSQLTPGRLRDAAELHSQWANLKDPSARPTARRVRQTSRRQKTIYSVMIISGLERETLMVAANKDGEALWQLRCRRSVLPSSFSVCLPLMCDGTEMSSGSASRERAHILR